MLTENTILRTSSLLISVGGLPFTNELATVPGCTGMSSQTTWGLVLPVNTSPMTPWAMQTAAPRLSLTH